MPTKTTKTTKTTKNKRAARVRLTVQCGDDLRFFEIPLPVASAEEFQRAISLAAISFSQTFDAKLKTQMPSPCPRLI
jgi:flagellar motor switch protein FliM